MADIEFVLPLNKEILLESTSDSYYVKEVCIVSSLKDQLKQARNACHYDGPEYILNHFDVYYSVLYHGEKLDIEFITKAIEDLMKPCQQLYRYLEALLEDSEIAPEIQLKTINILKMLIYLMTQTCILLENKIDTKNRNDINMIKGVRKTKPTKSKSNEDDTETENKFKQLNLLLKILQLPIRKLWDPPTCDEQFLNLTADMCFLFLQNTSIKQQKELWKVIFYIFGVLIKNHNYSLPFTVRLTQAIKDHEHLEAIVPGGIKILVEEYNCQSLVRELVREMTEWQADDSFQDVPGTKHCSNILIELTGLMPELMLPEVMYLLKYLNHSSYTMRNCILSVITEVIITVLSKESMSDEYREIRNQLLSKLMIHICDVNAHVRSKVLQHWTRLHGELAIPLDIQLDVLKTSCGRLRDKATLVRKNAVQLLATFLKCNPYAATLDIDECEKELKSEMNKLNTLKSSGVPNEVLETMRVKEIEWAEMVPKVQAAITENIDASESEDEDSDMETDTSTEDIEEQIRFNLAAGKYKQAFFLCKGLGNKNSESREKVEAMDQEQQIEFYTTLLHSIHTEMNKNAQILADIRLNRLAEMTPQQIDDIKTCESSIKYFTDAVIFLKIVNNAIPLVKDLLRSTTMTDVHEAIHFFVTAHQFKIKNASDGLMTMLTLMNSNEQDRRNAVIEAYKEIFLNFEGNQKERANILVTRLIELLKTVKSNDVQHLSNVVKQWTSNGDIDNSVIALLWNTFTKRSADVSDEDSLIALHLLTMAATGRKTIVERNMNLLTEFVFGDRGAADPRLFIAACNMLSVMGNEEINVTSEAPSFRVPLEDPMWENLVLILMKIFRRKDPFSHSATTAAVDLIYKICRKPDTLAARLIKSIMSMIEDQNGNIYVDNKIDIIHLSCLCHLLGEIAIRQFTFLDVTVYKELKRRNYLREERKKSRKQQQKKNDTVLDMSKASASCRVVNKSDEMEESFMEGATADDTDAEFILRVCECEIVSANLLGQYTPMLVHIVKHPHRYPDECVQASATQALIRYMIVSTDLCKEHIQLITTALDKSKFPAVRNNIFIGFADLLHRFPNVIEPWSHYLFKTVKDENESVRITAVSIISRLIMEDMLRVKGTIADLVLCIVDTSEIIVQMTEEFFQALAQKGNAIYNVLPDIISRLSNDKEQIDEALFKKVMSFLITLIDKDKQIESLVGKLCLRFKLSVKPRVWQDIAYCLTLLSYNEKSLMRLEENFGAYKTCLEDDAVYDMFISIINKNKNSSKDEIKHITKKLDHLIRTGEVNPEDDTSLNETKRNSKSRKGKKQKV